MEKLTVEQFAALGVIRSRRGFPVSGGYLYRMIREYLKGKRDSLPFKIELEGEKKRVWIVV